jgi:hypothetical protein
MESIQGLDGIRIGIIKDGRALENWHRWIKSWVRLVRTEKGSGEILG